VAWIAVAVLAVVVVAVLLVVTAKKHHDDFWRVAVPGYLTGVGTLALATVTFFLLREGVAERKALIEAQAQRDRDDALREASKIIPRADMFTADAPIDVLHAGSEPIVAVHLVSGASREGTPPHMAWSWEQGNGFAASYVDVLLPGSRYRFGGRWVTRWGFPEDQDLSLVKMPRPPSTVESGGFEATIAWTDSRGLNWRRTGANLPEQLSGPWSWVNSDSPPEVETTIAPPP
jgi:hypothetical protein